MRSTFRATASGCSTGKTANEPVWKSLVTTNALVPSSGGGVSPVPRSSTPPELQPTSTAATTSSVNRERRSAMLIALPFPRPPHRAEDRPPRKRIAGDVLDLVVGEVADLERRDERDAGKCRAAEAASERGHVTFDAERLGRARIHHEKICLIEK